MVATALSVRTKGMGQRGKAAAFRISESQPVAAELAVRTRFSSIKYEITCCCDAAPSRQPWR